MLRFEDGYYPPETFPSEAKTSRELDCVEMDSSLPFYAASVQMANGNIRWLFLSGPSALARAHEGLADGYTALAVYQLEPDFEDGIELRVARVLEWVCGVRVAISGKVPHDAYRIVGEVLIPTEQ